MWSKTRKGLLDRLASSLQGRVDYHFAVYTERRRRQNGGWPNPPMHVFEIHVDGGVMFASNPNFYGKFRAKERSAPGIYWFDESRRKELTRTISNEVIRDTGLVCADCYASEGKHLATYIHEYLNVLTFD